ncbi:hypothetical protein AY599_05785 [Leptolyngbya valderiana BDU 20041]|nr:hypothetical protein AY599_05785 [Leptolyngbya valderiana BDU 20041]
MLGIEDMPAKTNAIVRQLRAAVDRFENALGELTEAIAWTNDTGRVQWCNRGFAKLLGRSRSDLYQIDIVELFPVESDCDRNGSTPHPFHLALTSDSYTTQIYHSQNRDGRPRVLELFYNTVSVEPSEPHVLLVARERTETPDRTDSSSLYQLLADHSTDWISRQTLDGIFLYTSPAGQRLLGYAPDRAIGRSAFELYHPKEIERLHQIYQEVIRRPETPISLAHRIRHKNEYYLWFETTFNAVRSPQGNVTREIVAVSRDVTDRLSYQTTLQRNEKRFRALIENVTDAIFILDAQGMLRYASPSAEKLLGYTSEKYLGQSPLQFLEKNEIPKVRRAFYKARRFPGQCEVLREFRIRHADGTSLVFEAAITNLLSEPALEGIVVNCHNITERKKAEVQLRYDALHDALTGLPNRTLFMERLSQAIAYKKRQPNYSFAVLYLDLDRFKSINDSLGHLAGDRLLVEVAKRLKSLVRQGDTVARLSGDEFAILLQDMSADANAQLLADRLQNSLQNPLELEYQEIFVTASIGIVLVDTLYQTPSDVLRDADTAMYRAKQLGKARQEIFDSTMSKNNLKQLRLGVDLRHALDRKELELFYQPIVSLMSGRISGFEVLLRWNHDEFGRVSPDEFIPIAEETGAIVPLGWWVLSQACHQMKRWRKQFTNRELTVCVNLSGRQFSQPSIVERVEQALKLTHLDPCFLKLEITETTIVENEATVLDTLQRLKKMGVQLSIDDFGTGYSSLSRLRSFPIDTLKIDKSFVQTMERDRGNLAITKSIVMLAETLNISTVAEGVEIPEHLNQLRQLGCEYAQGYLFSRPVNAEQASEVICENPTW